MSAIQCACRPCVGQPVNAAATAGRRREPVQIDGAPLPTRDTCRGRHCSGNHEKRSA